MSEKKKRLTRREFLKFAGIATSAGIVSACVAPVAPQTVVETVVVEKEVEKVVKEAVEVGAGVSILPEPTVRTEAASGQLAAIPLAFPQLERPIGIIHRQRKVFTPTMVKFVELLKHVQDTPE